MPKSDIDAPTQRILKIVEVIAANGPITLMGLCAALPFSRAAIWRAVDTLREMGWVRMRAGDKAFELRKDFVAQLLGGHRSDASVEAIIPILEQLASFGPVHVDLGGFVETGVCRVLESTRKAQYKSPPQPLSLVDDDLAIAAQLAVPPPSLVVHLRAFMVGARDDERRIITSGEHGRTVARLREAGYFWTEDHSAIALSLAEFPGFALRAELWRLNRADIIAFGAQMDAFLGQRGNAGLQVGPT